VSVFICIDIAGFTNHKILRVLCAGLVLFSACVSAQLHNNELYRAGLAAYLDNDFEKAKTIWLQAAEKNSARAMFNLGLLNEQGNVEGATALKADNWFISASELGYPAADYHLGLRWLGQGGRDKSANALIAKAAAADYLPAQRHLALSNVSEAPFTVAPKLEYRGKAWINSRRSDSWTIQMLAFKERAKVESFIDEHQLQGDAAYFVEESGDGVLYKLIYGAYDTKEQAELAKQQLSPQLSKFGPWLRPLSSVQSVIDD